MTRKLFRYPLLFIAFLCLAFIVSMNLWIVERNLSDTISMRLTHDSKMLEALFASNIERDKTMLQKFLTIIKEDTALVDAFARRDRQELYSRSIRYFEWLQATDVSTRANMHFYLPETTSFLRMHQPDKYGDSLRGIRPMVVAVNDSHRRAQGYELGKYGLFLQIVEPVFLQGRYVGAMGIGFNIMSLLEDLKAIDESQYMILFKDACTCEEHMKAYEKLNKEQFAWMQDDLLIGEHPKQYLPHLHLENTDGYGVRMIGEKHMLINYSLQIRNFEDQVVGQLLSVQNVDNLYSDYSRNVLIVAVSGIISFLLLLFVYLRCISRDRETASINQ